MLASLLLPYIHYFTNLLIFIQLQSRAHDDIDMHMDELKLVEGGDDEASAEQHGYDRCFYTTVRPILAL
jgi:hypothetical protein